MSFTYHPKKRKRANTHGFLRRKNTRTGRQVLVRRRRKGRKKKKELTNDRPREPKPWCIAPCFLGDYWHHRRLGALLEGDCALESRALHPYGVVYRGTLPQHCRHSAANLPRFLCRGRMVKAKAADRV